MYGIPHEGVSDDEHQKESEYGKQNLRKQQGADGPYSLDEGS